ncbi:7TM diverse intracellular signaling domain-containing protein [Mucilaginibacter sabulilitoris]|uniref:histidine kinase n=1 Tax=Mucilaginibacter sabulilitoris TaxID=1173583 RepID=A0ABZ0TUI7_9SPHI|nr:7TM diverse intracellular signaling domain-containing protein [Mucilaginibacter sabulilitoris]WPU96780.1 7TM diverse intracellular signaling domain-containing protein [Mucilaginibacter sabulilitoris]
MGKILVTAYLLFSSIIAFADKPDTVVINNNQSTLLTNRYFYELEDTNANLTINNVLNKEFYVIKNTLPTFKYTKSTTWLKFNIKNDSTAPFITISIAASVIDEFDLYYIDNTTTNIRHLVPDNAHNDQVTQNIMFINCPVLPGTSNTIYLRIKSSAPNVIPIKVYGTYAFLKSRNIENITTGVIIGVFIVMALYNLLLFFIVGDRSYIYYVCYILFFGLSQVLKRGYGGNLFTTDKTILNNYIIPLVRVLFGYSILLFISEFLQLKQNLKRWYKYYLLLYAIYSILLVAVLCGMVVTAYNLITISTCITSVSLLIIGAHLYFGNGFKPAKFFMLGWGIFLISILISVASNRGFIPYNNLTTEIVVYSSVLELILFSAALAEKINFYRFQKNESQNFALAVAKENERLITQQNILLENKVRERTNELIATNKNLSVSIDNLMSTQKQLIDNEKMASLGQLTAGVAHEINNPINFVSSNIAPLRLDFDELFVLLNKYDDALNNPEQSSLLSILNNYKQKIDINFIKEEITILLNGIEEGANRTAEIVNSLRAFSSTDEQILKTTDINKSILNNLLILRSTIPYYIEIKPVFDKLEPLHCYPGKINQLIINLINNSIYAIKAREHHSDESVMIITKDYADHISIEITDTGIGMSDETKQRIFEPFFTTKSIGEGTGLGLSIVFGIIEKHRGNIEVISSPGNGATFIVTLPKNLA